MAKTKTIRNDKVKTEDLNEWGYPDSSKYSFAGFKKGFAYWKVKP